MRANVGDYVKPDNWGCGENLHEGFEYVDKSFQGSEFMLPSIHTYPVHCPVNIEVTGRKPNRQGFYRCRIEFVNDSTPSDFSGGWILLKGETR